MKPGMVEVKDGVWVDPDKVSLVDRVANSEPPIVQLVIDGTLYAIQNITVREFFRKVGWDK